MCIRDRKLPELTYSVSATTRAPREGEVEGQHYFFMTREEFLRKRELNEFIETAEFCGNWYGTPRRFIEDCLEKGTDVILDIEIQGAAQVRRFFPDAVLVFLMPPSIKELRARDVYKRQGYDDVDIGGNWPASADDTHTDTLDELGYRRTSGHGLKRRSHGRRRYGLCSEKR